MRTTGVRVWTLTMSIHLASEMGRPGGTGQQNQTRDGKTGRLYSWALRYVFSCIFGYRRVFIGYFIKCFIIGIAPVFLSHSTDKRHMSAVENLAQARSEAQEYGMERRREIRRRVREYQLEQEERDDHRRCNFDYKSERK